jgi:hypothetical protein
VRIFYDGEDGQSFTDVQRLDLDLYRDLRPVRRDTIHEVSETLKQIERRMTGWSSSLDRLLFRTPDEVQHRPTLITPPLERPSCDTVLAASELLIRNLRIH